MADNDAVRSGFMTEMTPRERSELVRRQSRDYIAALRQSRLKRAGVPAAAPAQPPGTAPSSTFRPSSQASARAMEARAKPKPTATEAAASPLEEAAEIRRTSAEALSQMRESRRPKAGSHGRTKSQKADPSARADDASTPVPSAAVGSASPEPLRKDAGSGGAPAGSAAVDPDVLRTAQDPAPSVLAPQRRTRSKRTMPSESGPAASGSAGTTRDIDVITGLGPALKSKLRQSGIATVNILSMQKPERLREILGPAGRLVNLEALVRAARAACGGSAPGAAWSEGTKPSSRMAPSRRSES